MAMTIDKGIFATFALVELLEYPKCLKKMIIFHIISFLVMRFSPCSNSEELGKSKRNIRITSQRLALICAGLFVFENARVLFSPNTHVVDAYLKHESVNFRTTRDSTPT